MLKTLLQSMRLPFLVLTPASLLLGLATATAASTQIQYSDIILIFIGAFFAHISVNTLNEYEDFKSGLDAKTTKTPFSGGSGALIENPSAVKAVLYTGIVSLIITMLIGTYFVFSIGWPLFLLGLLGVVIIITYTKWLNRSPFLCLIAPGMSFGPLMVIGTHLILSGEYSAQAALASLVPFFLANNLLLLNQYPDIAADKTIGRRHIPIAYGTKYSSYLYGAFVLATCTVIIIGIFIGLLPILSLITLLPISFAMTAFVGAIKHAASLQALIPYLKMNVAAAVITPILLALSIIYG